ncbi:KH domain-containing protein [Rubritalea tangerina]|uniref:KH domain-containing protein n=2 Tax=Rubritalea tangerina TaxID=430798 RepID=A0ABW4Z952_9BACT
MHETTEQIRNFLQFVALQFISHPSEAQLKVAEATDNHVRFRLILNKADVAILIGRNGFTASAIRNVLKAAAIRDGINATLQIVSHEEEHQRLAAIEAGQTIEEEDHLESHDETDDDFLEETN